MTFQQFKEEFAHMILDSKDIKELTANLIRLDEGMKRLIDDLRRELSEK